MVPETPAPESAAPLVSAIIVSHDCRQELERCLDALARSTVFGRLEVLVVDAGSRDGSADVDHDRPWVQVIRMPMYFGKTRARNIGTRTARSDLILFLDPRVELAPDCVEKLAAHLEQHPDATAVFPEFHDADGRPVECAFRLPDAAALRQASLELEALPRAPLHNGAAGGVEDWAVLIRKTFLGGMNYLNEKRFSEYWALLDVWLQVRGAGKKIRCAEAARALLHPPLRPVAPREDLAADAVSGAAAYLAKYEGFFPALLFRIQCFFAALFSFRLSLAWGVLLGRRLDPTQ